jgi:hypothetical protein
MIMTATTYVAAVAAVTTAGLLVSLSVSDLTSVRINELEEELEVIKGYDGVSEKDAEIIKSGVVGEKPPIKEEPGGPKTTEPREEPEAPEKKKRKVAPNPAD